MHPAVANGSYNVNRVRADFPAPAMKVYGKPLVYLDNAASAQKPQAVLKRRITRQTRMSSRAHARAVGLFDTSLNHRARCCKSSGIGAPVFLPSIRAHWAVMSAIVY
jgi:hypothetical protein